MGFWDKLPVGININPLIPKVGQQNDRQQKGGGFSGNPLPGQPVSDVFERKYVSFNANDSEIWQKSLFRFLPNDSLRLELQLDHAENELKDVKGKIQAVKILKLDEKRNKLPELEEKQKEVNKLIGFYRKQYRELGAVYFLSDVFSEGYKKSKEKLDEIKLSFGSNKIISKIAEKLFPDFAKSRRLKEFLNKFGAAQDNLKNLFSQKSYPEKEEYFSSWIAVMAKANKLNSGFKKLFDANNQENNFLERVKTYYSLIIQRASEYTGASKEYLKNLIKTDKAE